MRPARILLSIAGLPAGGAERQMALLARHLDRANYDVGLLIFGRPQRIHYPEIFEERLWFKALELAGGTSRARLLPMLMTGIRRAVEEFRPDVIHSSLNVANHAFRATSVLSRWRIPIITSVRNDFRLGHSRMERLAERLLSPWSRRIITNSPTVRDQLVQDLHLAEDRVRCIANAVDARFFAAEDKVTAGGPAGRIALVVGRFTVQKDHLGLMHALTRLEAAGQLGDWHFVLVGEGPLEAEIRAAAPPGRVSILAPVADLLPFYRKADLLVLPSLWEGMPNVALEAQATGCPVALTRAANAAGVVQAGSGWELAGRELSDALAPILAVPAATMRAMGADASRMVATRHSVAAMTTATAAVYDEMRNRSG